MLAVSNILAGSVGAMRYPQLLFGCCLLLLLGLPLCRAGATEEQMWAAGRLMRDVCQPKFPKITPEIADGIQKGNLPDDKDAKCYINCVMEMMQTMKKGKFQMESTLKQVELLMPDSYKASYRKGIGECKDAAAGIKNNCDAAHALLSCFRDKIDIFVFP
ncbi:general odorant-binding protein 19a [Drosophila montana]|uniref:general odorant-binding protein 19a n=1 Tax=Drosophila montana TaxID=40370 RepID=UPI00313CC43D